MPMGLFGNKKTKKEEKAAPEAVEQTSAAEATAKDAQSSSVKDLAHAPQDLSWVLLQPRITEKAVLLGEKNVYTFDVHPRANKIQVKEAVQKLYGVQPIRVNMVVQKTRSIIRRNKKATRKGTKKALVFLKKGDTIAVA